MIQTPYKIQSEEHSFICESPSKKYLLENNISIADSHMLRAGPEDLEKYENGLGLVPIEGEEPSIFSLFALIYIIFPFRRKRPSKTE